MAIADYLGSSNFVGATLERAGIVPDASMAQVRQAVTEYAVLPLGSQRVHEKLEPHIKALLLYGHHNTGKKLLAHAIANATGACQGLRVLTRTSFWMCLRARHSGGACVHVIHFGEVMADGLLHPCLLWPQQNGAVQVPTFST